MTVTVELPDGKKNVTFRLPESHWVGSYAPAQATSLPNPEEAIAQALAHPLNRPRLRELVRPGEKIAIIVDDHTRATPAWRILPHVAAELEAAGLPDKDVTVVIARGTHRPSTETEVLKKLGATMLNRFQVIQHDCQDEQNQTFMGITSLATPVWINSQVAAADRRIAIGHIGPSPYAGYSGGGKLILPGVAALDTINFNHSFVPAAFRRHGSVDLPTRRDMDEAIALVGVDMEIDTVFDSEERIITVLAGDPAQVYRRGVALAKPLFEVSLSQRLDVAVASGEPYSLDLYQASRAVEYADGAVRPGGTIVVVADCPDGVGGDEFYHLLTGERRADDFLRAAGRRTLKVTFAVLGYFLARIKEDKTIYVKTDNISDDTLRAMGFQPCHDLQATIDTLLAHYGPKAAVAAFPRGSVTIPVLSGREEI
jgi:nickel-dependent lactate racemase